MTFRLLLDSGAYSLWRSGQHIDLADYIAFLQRNPSRFENYITLDQIPGEDGRREWRAELVEEAAKQSYRNHRKMRDAGLRPVPVVHIGERQYWLRRYADDGEPMIALGVKGTYDAMRWLDKCFAILPSYPHVRTHG